MTLQIAAATDVGLKREHNEDFHASWTPTSAAELARRGELMVLADGMGGSAAGEIASHTAVDAVIHQYRELDAEPELALQRAIEAAHRSVHRMGREHPEWAGMGTTCTAVVVRGSEVHYAHVGDSRAYLVREGWIIQLTTDHSLVQQMVVQQLMTPEQARVDPRRNVLTRSVGVGEAVEVDAGEMPGGLLPGDTLMLCSDGLHGLVSDPELGAIARQPDLDRACAELVELARARGGHDNITVMLARLAA